MKYFNNITSLDELKKAYRRLAMKYHPDCGGSDEIMKEINAEHDALFETLKANHNKTAEEAAQRQRGRVPPDHRNGGRVPRHHHRAAEA